MKPRRKQESGFALLLVFLMAAVIGITLYSQLPRVAFQAQRQKEQLLMERGHQFKRAIQLYLRANKNTRWPADLDDLQKGYNNQHFLRHRYKDPMTGKDEWRLIHIQNGVLTDSINSVKQGDKKGDTPAPAGISEFTGISDAQAQTGQVANPNNRRRASEGGAAPVGPDGQPVVQPGQPYPVMGPNGVPLSTAASVAPGQTYGVAPPPIGPGLPGQSGMQNGIPVAGVGGATQPPGPGQLPGYPGPPVSSQNGGQSPGQLPPQFQNGGGPTYPQPGTTPGTTPGTGQQQSTAAQMIGNLLTSPRPGGMAGLNQQQGTVIGGGIAGVASKADAEGIMVYSDRTNYGEWEFIYDPTKDPGVKPPSTGAPGTPVSSIGTPAGTGTTGTPVSSMAGNGATSGANGKATDQQSQIQNSFGGGGLSPDVRPGKP